MQLYCQLSRHGNYCSFLGIFSSSVCKFQSPSPQITVFSKRSKNVVRRRRAHGDVIIVRFADDIVIGFQGKSDAKRFWAELTERMRKFDLELHPEKTRLLEFGPFAIRDRQRRGEGRPETFNFLGFTHICGKKRSSGYFTVLRQTVRKRLQAKLNEVKAELRHHQAGKPINTPVPPGYSRFIERTSDLGALSLRP